MNFKKLNIFAGSAAIATIGFGLFFLILFLLVLPNTINTISCTIEQNSVETTFAARKVYCSCIIVTTQTSLCDSLLAKNQTGRCIETDCCFQSDDNECEIWGSAVCDLDYCWKTLARVSLSYSDGNRTLVYLCEGDWLYCDLKTNSDECTARLKNAYNVGARTCYYRKADDRVEFHEFDNNGKFIGGIVLLILVGSLTLVSMCFFICCTYAMYQYG